MREVIWDTALTHRFEPADIDTDLEIKIVGDKFSLHLYLTLPSAKTIGRKIRWYFDKDASTPYQFHVSGLGVNFGISPGGSPDSVEWVKTDVCPTCQTPGAGDAKWIQNYQ